MRSQSHNRALLAVLSPDPGVGGTPRGRGSSKAAGPSEPRAAAAPALTLARTRSQLRANARSGRRAHSGTHPTRAHGHRVTRTHGGWPTAAPAIYSGQENNTQLATSRKAAQPSRKELSFSLRQSSLLNLVPPVGQSQSSVREYDKDALSKNRNSDFLAPSSCFYLFIFNLWPKPKREWGWARRLSKLGFWLLI